MDIKACYWAALSMSFRLISIRLLMNNKAWGPQVIKPGVLRRDAPRSGPRRAVNGEGLES